MKITKLSHCCLLIETKGRRILTDPGSYTIEQNSKLSDIDAVLFTHEHGDHYHLESLKMIIANNPLTAIYANTSVSQLLEKEQIMHACIKHGESVLIGEISLTGIGEKHALMHSSIPASWNTGYMIDSKLWYPGDAFTNPQQPVDILALPVSGPWMKLSEAIDYALLLKPRISFPVHDAIRFGSAHVLPAKILAEKGILFVPMVEGDSREF